jgi:ParB family transcriptional regulator, chromosome partitioning protein
MARRNLFQPPALPSSSAEATVQDQKPRFPNTGAMSGVKSTLKDLSSNAVREIAIEMIEEGGPKDRLTFTDADVASLAESIRTHGQQVPIMVRPIADKPGHYQIVYGRRRLRALRALGLPAKALVRSLSDEEAILAQGQENSQRLDPSFVEKALFAAELLESGYEQTVILDALAVDKPMLSRMAKVTRAVPESAIQAIGSAHGVGRRRWEELADRVKDNGINLELVVSTLRLDLVSNSDDRFSRVSDAVAKMQNAASNVSDRPSFSITTQEGTPLAELTDSARALSVKLTKAHNPEFAQWLRDNAETELRRLYEAWQSSRASH